MGVLSKYYVKLHDLVISHRVIAVTLISIVICYIGLNMAPMYQSNDDPGMIFAFSGKLLFDEPSPLTAFTTKIWGSFSIWLYKWVAIFGWDLEVHTVLIVVVIFISFWTILYRIVFLNRSNYGLLLILVLTSTFIVLPFYTLLQFTMAAAISTAAGAFIIIESIGSKKYIKIFIGLVLLAIGYLIRPDTWLLVWLCATLAYLLRDGIYGLSNFGKTWKYYGQSIFVFIGLNIVENAHLTANDENIIEFNKFRSSITDYNIIDTAQNTVRSSYLKKMRPEGLALFNQWYYGDENLYSTSVDYRQLNQSLDFLDRLESNRLKSNFRGIMMIGFEIGKDRTLILAVLTVIILLILFGNRFGWYRFILILLCSCMILFLVSVLYKPTPFRIYYPVLAIMLLSISYYNLPNNLNISTRNTKLLLNYLFIFSISGYSMYTYISLRNWQYLEIKLPSNKNKLLLVSNTVIPFKHLDPFHISDAKVKQRIYCTGSFSVLPQAHRNWYGGRFEYLTTVIMNEPSAIQVVLNNPDRNEFSKMYSEEFITTFENYYNSVRNGNIKLQRVMDSAEYEYAVYNVIKKLEKK